MKNLTDDQKTRLISLMATVEVLWTPLRFQKNLTDEPAAVAEQRSAFRKRGISLVVGGSAATRQRGNRDLKALADEDLIELIGSGKGRCVRFTKFGDDYTRSLVPTKRIDEAWIALEIIDATDKTFEGRSNCGYQLEFDILGIHGESESENGDGDYSRLLLLEDFALPLLANGFLESSSDGQGRLGYRLSKSGKKALAAGKPKAPKRMPKYDPALGKEYIDLYCAGLRDRENWKQAGRNHCVIPLGCGSWPSLPGTPKHEYTFEELIS